MPKSGYSKLEEVDIASWQDLIELNKEHLINIEKKSIELVEDKLDKFKDYTPIVPVSMGKDSMVTCHLVRTVRPDTKAIFNNTTLDVAETYMMAKKFPNCEIMSPDKGFYQYVESDNMIPTRFARFCCRIFKVGVMVSKLDKEHKYLHFMGMRNEESNTRAGYKDEWINKAEWGSTKWQGILPIRKWTELDVWLYTMWRRIEINPKYKQGYTRVGCHCACPYYAKSTWVLDKYWYPKAYKRWRDILAKDFIENKKWIVMNCTLDEYVMQSWNGGTFRDEPTEEVIKEFAEYNDIADFNVAANFFNKECANGCKRSTGKITKIKSKEVLGMNMKMHGRNINKFYCKKCLMKEFNWDNEQWDEQVDKFKQDGCTLF